MPAVSRLTYSSSFPAITLISTKKKVKSNYLQSDQLQHWMPKNVYKFLNTCFFFCISYDHPFQILADLIDYPTTW